MHVDQKRTLYVTDAKASFTRVHQMLKTLRLKMYRSYIISSKCRWCTQRNIFHHFNESSLKYSPVNKANLEDLPRE